MIKWRVTNNLRDPRCIRVAIRRETKRERVIVSYRLMQIADLADRAATAKWCVTTLAQNCGVSLPTFERFFHESKQQCPRDWINAERMRRACELLERRERVNDVARILIYEKSRNFSTAFTKFFGYSPRDYVKRMENGGLKMARTPSPLRPGRGQGEVSSVESNFRAQLRKPNSAVTSLAAKVRRQENT